MEQEQELSLPADIRLRLTEQFTSDIDQRLKELTYLVSLQETELTLLWYTIFALSTYIIYKEHKNASR